MTRPGLLALSLVCAVVLCLSGLRPARTQSNGLRRITNTADEGININPSISGDGKIVAFESTEDVAGAGGSDHFRAIRANVAFDPATLYQIGGTRAVAPAISQDGSRIAFASKDDPLGANPDGNSEIFLFDGAKLIQTTNTSPGDIANRVSKGNFQPSISDDGRFITFSSNRDLAGQNSDGNLEIFVYDSVANTFAQLTNSSGTVGFSDAKISGNGASIAYIRDAGAIPSSRRDLLRQPRSGSGPAVLLAADVQSLQMTYGRAISDDGTRVVYSAETAADASQVFLYDGRGGSAIRQITSLGTRVTEVPLHPTISGDGTRIAFATRRAITGFANSDNSIELYTFDIPTGQFARVTSAPAEADGFDGTSRATEVVSSLNDDGSIAAFNFPRALSGPVTAGLENRSEIYVTATAARPPFAALTAILNGASFGNEPAPIKSIAPDSIAVARGSALANSTLQSQRMANGNFPTNVGGTSVTVNDRAAQIFFVSPGQVNFLVPPQTEIGNAEVVTTNSDNFSSRGTVPTLRAAPGVFTKSGDGIGEGMILTSDTLQEGPFDPSSGNLRLTIFATGARNASQTLVLVGGRILVAESVLASPDMPGLDEVRVRIPADLRGAGNVNLSVQSDGRDSNPVTLTFNGDPNRAVFINEVLADPPDGLAGDANHDGARDGTQDEFVELVNGTASDAISLGGWTVRTRATGGTTESTRFTFAAGTTLPAGEAIVVFGGGGANFNPNDAVFGCAQVVRATSSAGLSLTNGGLTILIRDGAGNLITQFSFGGSTGLDGDNNQSLTRSPDITGTFVQHTSAGGANGVRFSPGLKTNGAPFGNCPARLTSVTISPPSATIGVGATTQFTAQAFDQFGRTMNGVTINFASDNTAVATVDSVSMNSTTGVATATVSGHNPGAAHITAAANDGSTTINSSQSTLTVTGPSLSINDVSVNEGNSGSTTFSFTVSLSQPAPAGGVKFDIATQDGSATAGNDYVARSLLAQTIPAGQLTYAFDVTVNGDVNTEPNETFFVNISNVSANASIGDGQGLGTIQNDDTPVIVISQLYGGGGNSGATLKNDFIEIYNRGTTTVDLTGWSVQYNSATGTGTWSVTPLCPAGPCLIQPGRYFLVQEDQGSGGTQDLPTPNAVGTIAMTTGAGKVAVSSSTTALSGGCPSSPNILDIVGYGSTASCFEGSGPAGAPGNATADFRKAGGCVDTNDNANDFFVAQPNPRNSASPVGNCKPEITINDVTVTENNSGTVNATLTVSLATASAQTVTVDFATADGTATAPGDYQTNNGTLTFNPGDLNKTITVLVNGDTLDEAAETFFVNLSNASNAVILDNQGQGTINDNDPTPSLSINDLSIAEGDSSTTQFTFTVSLSTASGQTVTVNYATADGTATSPADYQSSSGLLTFNPGDISKPVTVMVNGDATFEQNETFFVNLTGATNASISDAQGQGTITNDDAAPPTPTFFITNASVTEGNSATTNAVFDVSLSPASSQIVQVDFNTVNGNATLAGNDYQANSGTLIFNPGDGPKQITVLVNGDLLVEPDETFTVHLSNATNGAGIGTPDGTGTIQNDDAADLVISQTYPGGGLTGATFTHDFIELFNQGTTTVDFAVTPYSVQFLSTSASTWAKTDLSSGTLAPGRYFLVKGTAGTSCAGSTPCGATLPTADATGSLNLTSTAAGKVALVVGSTLLVGDCPGDNGSPPFNPAGGTVVDFAGYGGTAATASHCYEGTGPAPYTLSSNTTADFRKFGGCQDTNDNAADFVAAAPNPRNSSSPANDCTTADLEITKTDSPDPVITGSNVTYTITVTNHGPATATSVVVTDNLPANVTFVSCASTGSGVCGGTGNNRSITFASLAGAAAETITLVATANGPAGAPITNTATVTSSTTDPIPGNNSATATTDVNNPNSAELAISKSDSIDPVAPGGNLTYTISLTNSGPDAAQTVVVTDTFPSGVTFVDCSSNQGGVCGGTATSPTVSFSSLANGATATITIRVTVSNALTTGAVITNTTSVAASSIDSNSGNDSDSETTNVQTVNAGDIVFSEVRFHGSAGASDDFVELYNPTTRAIDISGFKVFRSNASGTKTLHVTINSNVILSAGCHYLLTNTAYDDGVPGDQTYGTSITDDGGVAVTPPSGTDSTGILDQVGLSSGSAYKEGTPLTALTTNVDRSYERKPGGAFGNGTDTNDNSADFFLNPSSSNPQNSSTGCLNTSSADLSITKTDSPDPVTIGSNITYTITVLNNGAATAQNVLVTDNLPAEVTFVSCGATGGAVCGGSGNNRTVTLTSLPSGSSFTATIVATANGPHGSTATNTATVSSTTTDANSSNDSATATTLMQEPTPSLSIDDVTLTEGTGGTTNFVFTVTLTPSSSQTVTVNYATSSISPATAVAGTDYTSTTGMLTFTPSDTSEQITVQVNGDSANEAICETFFVKLSSAVNATISDDTGQGGITDDDGTKLVISQVYGGGGNGGATYTHDFIEIFNRGNTTVSLTGWSVQYAAAAGTTWSVTNLTGSIAPGKYYLIQENSGGAAGVALPTPDATGTITMAAGAGKVALVSSTTALTGACPSSSSFIDLIGYGTTANCFEGSGVAPTPSATLSDQRAAHGCTDVGNNATDFATATPAARNSATPADTCSCSTSYSSFFSFGNEWLKGALTRVIVRGTEPSLNP